MSQSNLKQPLHNFAIVSLCTLLSGCISFPAVPTSSKITFGNPPQVGDELPQQREFVVCETKQAAIYTASLGFVHFECAALRDLNYTKATVTARELVELDEGPAWLAVVSVDNKPLWLPIPWHDWI